MCFFFLGGGFAALLFFLPVLCPQTRRRLQLGNVNNQTDPYCFDYFFSESPSEVYI